MWCSRFVVNSIIRCCLFMFCTSVHYTGVLTVTDAAGSARVASLIGTIEVIDIDSVLYTKDFEGFNGDDPEDGWLTVSLASLADWNLFTQSGQQGVFINGFRSDEASDDWLISPVIPIVPGERATLSFDLNRFFSGGSFGVFASVDYDPVSGDPNAATWLPIATSFTTDDWSRPSDLVIPLSGNVRIGFHYTSDGVEAGHSQRIGADRIQVVRVATSDAFVDTDFEGAVGDPVPGPWTAVNVASDAVWDFREWNGRVGAFMNGFGADGASEDWLISPAMDFSGDEIPILSFSHFVRFGGPNLQVLVSSDYVSDPNAASWTDLQIDFGNLPEREWIDFKDISLDAFDGSATHLAFKYVSNGGEAGDGRLAGIDSVVIAKSDVAPMLAVEATFPLSAGAGEPVTVVAVASGGSLPYTYAWDFGDGTTALGAEASHAYLDSGRFTATLVVTDGAGAKTVASAEIAILAFGEVVLEGMFTGDDDASIAEPWMAVSVASDRGWQIDTTGGAQGAVVNGFGADEASEDWLISPPFDLAFGAQTTLGFDYYQNFSGPELELLIGADFAPDTDPNTVHWSPIVHDLSTVPNSAWSRQSGIDLSGFVGRQCRLAFRYVTTGTAGGDGKLIGINGVRVRTIIPPMPAPETYTYEEWIGVNGYFKTGDPAGLASADADGDGFANGFEHRFDLSPKSGAGYENLPQISRLDDGTFRLTYRRIADETAWKVQLSADLESWKDAVEGQDIDTSIEKNEVIETVTLDLKAPETFFRVVLP